MKSQKKALTYALSAIGALFVAMFAFYYVQNRFAGPSTNGEQGGEEIAKEEKSEFVGTYSPSDGPLEGAGKRILFFTVNHKDDGGYLGSAKVDTIGTDESFFFECVDVRIEEKEFYLSCQSPTQGTISYSGNWEKTGDTIQTAGKVLWMQQGSPVLEQERRLQLVP